MMQGLKKRTRKAFGIRKKEKDSDSTGSPDKDKSKRSNGAPNGFYGEIDWDRYPAPKIKMLFSSSESEGDEEQGKKFKIRIKPLTANSGNSAGSTMDELKASVGTLAISPSPLRKSPCQMKRNLSSEEVARPRRSTPTPTNTPGPSSDPLREHSPAFFGTSFASGVDAHNPEDFMVETELWSRSAPLASSILSRSLPTGAPPPLPPKNIPVTPPGRSSGSVDSSGYYSVVPCVRGGRLASAYQDALLSDPAEGPSLPDLDSVFGPAETPRSGSDLVQCSWVSFSEGSPARPPPPDEPAPSPPLSSSPSDSTSTSPLNLPPPVSPPPPLHCIPPPDSPPPPPPSDSPLSPLALPCCFHLPEAELAQVSSIALYLPSDEPPCGAVSSPLTSRDDDTRTAELMEVQEEFAAFGTSPKDRRMAGGFRGTPPPLPPTPYKSLGGSPGPGSVPSSPARAGTPLTAGIPIPPLPPRPSSRPKLPPGKPNLADMARSFSPPIHSWSPPPFAPLARAESTSSISSITSLSAASTPTLVRELNLTVTACSRGPSPLTMGPQDTLPVAAAFTETISAYFKGADPTKCLVKITGEMVLSFPAGITRHFSSHSSPPVLSFTISHYSRLDQVLPNPQLLCCDSTPPTGDCKDFWVNMPNLLNHLKKVAEQRPQATYYNVDMLKYQVSAQGIQSTPLNLAVSWRGDAHSTDLRIDYKYNAEAVAVPTPLTNIHFTAAVNGGVNTLQATLPPATWNPETQKISWRISELSQSSENGGVGALLARFLLANGPSKPSQLAVQFTSEGSTLSGCDFRLVGSGYRLSLVKKRFSAGKYLADN